MTLPVSVRCPNFVDNYVGWSGVRVSDVHKYLLFSQTVLHYDVWHTHIFVIYERTSDVRMIFFFYQCRAVCHEGPIKFLLRRTVRRLNVRCVNVWRPNVIKCYASQRRTVLHTVMVISVNVIIIFITSLRHRTPSSCQISERVTWYFLILYLRWRKGKTKNCTG